MPSTRNPNGNTTLQNYTADLNPTNASSRLTFVGVKGDGNSVQVTWIGGNNATQYLLCSPVLVSTQWNTIFTNLPPTSVTNTVIISGNTAVSNLFYRINAHR